MARASYNRPKPFGLQAIKTASKDETKTYYRVVREQGNLKTTDIAVAKQFKNSGFKVEVITVRPF